MAPQDIVEDVRWGEVAAGRLRVRRFRPARGEPVGYVVMLPGLALPSYLVPLARRLAESGVDASVLDLLAFRGGRRAEASVGGLAEAAAQWFAASGPVGRTVLLGHSTGAQVAAEVALRPGVEGRLAALVLAGPTFAPHQRSLPRLALATCTAYRRDTPRELVVARDLVRVRTDVARIIRSGLGHRLEERVGRVGVPVTLTAGEQDTFAPRPWLEVLASRTGGSARVVLLPGSHNNVFPCAPVVSELVLEAMRGLP